MSELKKMWDGLGSDGKLTAGCLAMGMLIFVCILDPALPIVAVFFAGLYFMAKVMKDG